MAPPHPERKRRVSRACLFEPRASLPTEAGCRRCCHGSVQLKVVERRSPGTRCPKCGSLGIESEVKGKLVSYTCDPCGFRFQERRATFESRRWARRAPADATNTEQ